MRILVVILIVLTFWACSGRKEGTALITGRFTDAPGMQVRLEELVPEGTVVIDSLTTGADGEFRFDIAPKEATFYLLVIDNGTHAVLIAAPGDTVELICDGSAFPEGMIVKGPEDAVLLADFFARSNRRQAVSDSLQFILAEYSDDSLFVPLTLQFDTLFQQLWEDQRSDQITFLEKHPGSFASLIVVNYSFGVRPVFSMEEDMPWYRRADSALNARFPGNRHVVSNSERIAAFERQRQLNAGPKP